MILTAEGCIDGVMHRNVQFDRCEAGHQVFKCPGCGQEFLEAEDSCSGG